MALFAVVCPGPGDYRASGSLFSDGLTCVQAVAAGQAWFTDAAKTNMSSFTSNIHSGSNAVIETYMKQACKSHKQGNLKELG